MNVLACTSYVERMLGFDLKIYSDSGLGFGIENKINDVAGIKKID